MSGLRTTEFGASQWDGGANVPPLYATQSAQSQSARARVGARECDAGVSWPTLLRVFIVRKAAALDGTDGPVSCGVSKKSGEDAR